MWRVKGQDGLVHQLDRSIRQGVYAHAYLIVGPPQTGKLTLATDMAQAVNCTDPPNAPCNECSQCVRIASGQHADVVVLGTSAPQVDATGGSEGRRARTEIGIGDVREIQHLTSLTPAEGRTRVIVFEDAHRLSEEASNALLKTLEEPPEQVVLILTTHWEDGILATIRSRCRTLEFKPMPAGQVLASLTADFGIEEEEAQLLAKLSMGRLGWALEAHADASVMESRRDELTRISELLDATLEDRFAYASDLSSQFYRNRTEALDVLGFWLRWWRDMLVVSETGGDRAADVVNVDWVESLTRAAAGYSTSQISGFIRTLLETMESLEHNVNARLALEAMMLALPGAGARV